MSYSAEYKKLVDAADDMRRKEIEEPLREVIDFYANICSKMLAIHYPQVYQSSQEEFTEWLRIFIDNAIESV